MKVIVACEFSGIVRDAFIKRGHDAISCDLLETEVVGPHLKQDITQVDLSCYDLMIAHPPCTHLCVSGARWFKGKVQEQRDALNFVQFLLAAPIEKIAIENPIGVISSAVRKPDQIIQPYQFGDTESKATCLWLKNLPKLKPTLITPKWMRDYSTHKAVPSADRWKERSRTFYVFAEAFAQQWG
jgi:site-specific DNA-cytosine methylase